MDLALCGGEDYELLFAVDRGNVDLLNRMENRFKTKVTHIGEVVEPEEGITVLDDSGKRYVVGKKGFDHFL